MSERLRVLSTDSIIRANNPFKPLAQCLPNLVHQGINFITPPKTQ
jgi:hypothetical protein